MSLGRRNLNYLGDKFKLLFLGNNHVLREKELKLLQGAT
jgi:hypothetical protein